MQSSTIGHKARLVVDGSLTPEPVENIYSGVVSLRHLRLVIFLGELNNLELWGADIGNAYLEAYTNEKLFIIGGAEEFQELEGFILIFNKALYGRKSSGKTWAETFYDITMDLRFAPSKADPCVWMRENKKMECYEYIATNVDDLCIAAQNPGKSFKPSKKITNPKPKEINPSVIIWVQIIPETKKKPESANQRSILTGYLNPTNSCSSKIHPKT